MMKAKEKSQPNSNSKTNGKVRRPVVHHPDGRIEQSFLTSTGVEVFVGPMPPLLPTIVNEHLTKKWKDAGRAIPERPVYETDVLGEKQKHYHDETTLDTPEEKKAWADYLELQSQFNDEASAELLFKLMRRNIRFDIKKDWEADYTDYDKPKDPHELKWFWARAVVIGSSIDMAQMLNIAFRLAGVKESLVEAAEKTFLDQMEEPNSSEGTRAETGRLVHE